MYAKEVISKIQLWGHRNQGEAQVGPSQSTIVLCTSFASAADSLDEAPTISLRSKRRDMLTSVARCWPPHVTKGFVPGDEKWIFPRYPNTGTHWLHLGRVAEAVVRRGRFEKLLLYSSEIHGRNVTNFWLSKRCRLAREETETPGCFSTRYVWVWKLKCTSRSLTHMSWPESFDLDF